MQKLSKGQVIVPAGSPQAVDKDALVSEVFSRVYKFFLNETRHRPSAKMYQALMDIPRTVADIHNSTAPPEYFVCPLTTGVGKSVTLAKTLEVLKAGDAWGQHTGTVLCVGRLDRVKPMIRDMGLREDEYAVYVSPGSDLDDLGLGRENVNQAPILITTHQMVISRLSRPSAEDDPQRAEDAPT